MSVVPGGLDTDQQPPMTIPLRHFLVALSFLLAGVAVGAWQAATGAGGLATAAHLHLLLVGWVCVTIMGAMTQFVPVWSGVALHSRRLAAWQLPPVAVGVAGFAGCLLWGATAPLPAFGLLMLAGFWTFVYNVGRTLARVDGPDVTEGHFAVALGFFVLVTVLGVLLAVDLAVPILDSLGLARPGVVGAHATLAVFGAVLTTVLGALYQLGTMFTQTELHGIDVHLQRFETVAYPVGVVVLAAGRLLGAEPVAAAGGLLVVAAVAGFAVVLARKLHEMQVPVTPMHRRYAVVAGGMLAWAGLAAPAWLADPLGPAARFGAPGTGHLLAVGVVGFVVFGTLYHVVPFVVWVHAYSDRLGFEQVPMIDDLYDDRLAAADLAALLAGTGLLVGADLVGLPASATGAAGMLIGLGALAFVANLLLVVRRHGPQSLAAVLLGSRWTESPEDAADDGAAPGVDD